LKTKMRVTRPKTSQNFDLKQIELKSFEVIPRQENIIVVWVIIYSLAQVTDNESFLRFFFVIGHIISSTDI
jgi:hypothetical protein